ncbi:MAG TPA: hypothetical protein P5514_05550 [Bacteroidales bacterium]|nr:hypothetical protein [Bacteroidales bacterium]HPE57177.1 hypothetical protein [Bacteroidales bacterium]HRX96390.1 hypothetical protein [Bacteroidales bacterium]
MKKYLWLLLIALSSCWNGDKSSENVLARVHGEYLYESDLKGVIGPGTSVKDSIMLARNFINNWVQEKLVIDKAEKNLPEEELTFKKQLEDYRNSLIIYKYEAKLIQQELDTVVTDKQIEDYYNANIGNFQLKDDIVKAFYARFDEDQEALRKVRRFFYSQVPEDRDSLDKYIEKYANLYFLNDEVWIRFEDVLKHVPINTYNREAYLQNHRTIEIQEEPWIYFVHIQDYVIKDGVSPLSFEKENIRQIIINQRKLKLVNDMRDEVLQSAIENNDFEIY